MKQAHKKTKSLDDCGYIAILRDCNQECIFCSVEKSKKYVSFDDIKKQFLDYRKRGINQIALTGGEPTLHPDLLKIIKWGVGQGFDLRFLTNGVKLEDKKFVKALADAGLKRVVFSIHSVNEKTSDEISRKAGYHEKRMQGLMNVLEDGRIEVNINITILSNNYKELDSMADALVKLREGKEQLLTHVNLNFVDICGEAAKNLGCVAKYSDIELKLHKALEILTGAHISVKVERMPLCYIRGFEHLSSDANRLARAEHYYIKRLSKKEIEYTPLSFIHDEKACQACFYKHICCGVTRSYAQIYGTKELYPVFEDPVPIINRIFKEKKAKSKVYCKALSEYDVKKIEQALKQGFDSLGGLGQFIKQNSKVLIKPNLFINYPPEKCATTHPAVVQAIIRLVKNITKNIVVADSPGMEMGIRDDDLLEKTGMKNVCEEEGVICKNLSQDEFVPVRFIDYDVFEATDVAKEALEADVIINVPKLKTHGITFLTGAIKNYLGLISREERIYLHANLQAPENGGTPELFSQGLVDVYAFFQKKVLVNVMDAIESMEGNEGPLKGGVVKTGFLLISPDAVAVDSVASKILGYNSLGIPTTRIADARWRGFGREEDIEVIGDAVKLKEFSKSNLFETINRVKLIKGYGSEFVFKPLINHVKCCPACSRFCISNCPVNAVILKQDKPVVDYEKCISCFTCINLCPYNAVEKKKVLLEKGKSNKAKTAMSKVSNNK